ncbi:unnamed protein product [Adineta ricciae]|uniref:Uncharacterized protein n=1 Tax=Adineta ricciae TaxID=249248 RepID=A0A813S9U9_ADIRI|nr:unnamed protein product [Adineta ricciae]
MTSNIGYEYVNEESINHALKCTICDQPFIRPVSTNCKKKHKFCRHCIEQWLKRNSSCPKCRQILHSEDLISITEDIVVDVLNELRVKCTACGQTGLERGDFNNHIKHSCPSIIVTCPASDIKCSWTGPRRQLDNHLKRCSYEPLRPLISSLVSENQALKEQVSQLSRHMKEYHREMQHIKEQFHQYINRLDRQHSETAQSRHVSARSLITSTYQNVLI